MESVPASYTLRSGFTSFHAPDRCSKLVCLLIGRRCEAPDPVAECRPAKCGKNHQSGRAQGSGSILGKQVKNRSSGPPTNQAAENAAKVEFPVCHGSRGKFAG